ncbi:MAG: glycosyltransferase family 4 protein [Aestuariivirgaceae bacterium]
MPRRIIHVFRAPLGGVMRHVRDLVTAQHEMGLEVGLVTASNIGGAGAENLLRSLQPKCTLGICRIPMQRLPNPRDFGAYRAILKSCRALRPDILHGHGAKGGAFAALVGRSLAVPAFYTPHGGSLQFNWTSPLGFWSLTLEKILRPLFTGLIFVSKWEKCAYDSKIGLGGKAFRIVHTGLWETDFRPVTVRCDAADILFVGELRKVKGVDILLRAMAMIGASRPISAIVVGDGAERRNLETLCRRLGLDQRVAFVGSKPASSVLDRGRIMVVPSRFEAMPYIVLEAAASSIPVIATSTGGIPEILPAAQLVAPGDPGALARAIQTMLGDLDAWRAKARVVAASVRDRFSARQMAESIAAFYSQARNDSRA